MKLAKKAFNYIQLYILVGGIPTHLEKSWSSTVGMMTFPYRKWKVIQNSMVPNHQPVHLMGSLDLPIKNYDFP
jgi:hypothetical protein